MQNSEAKTIVLSLITHYPRWYNGKLQSIRHTDKIRGDLALECIQTAQKLGYHIVVVDGKSSRSFTAVCRKLDITFKKRNIAKRAPAKRMAFNLAAAIPGIQVIVATEPEKVNLLYHLPKIVEPILDGKADIVIPARTKKEFRETYPDFQYDSESEGNHLYNEYVRIHKLLPEHVPDLDVFFGPRIFRNTKKILSLFTHRVSIKIGRHKVDNEFFDPEEISNASFFPIVLALKRKLKVTGVTIPFLYPKLQMENEQSGNREYFEEKRRNQRLGILVELIRFLAYLERRHYRK